ncbi:Lactonase, 7-bladed beta-propeller-domain-containing protein [Emericellopsis atlantica]|uniref:Lactonase, 7-bladed beta-propeller-domain-containing protein n=1 Tax=Emericellopsis atlantica TaxID=2614577 RepID=A0A9P7ZVH8_9HYPO|nr:Lactonase, 7-bladed beta-propeller-domain-containing protein [Emericellopsis atlantica]KAG9259088.1 Lactonase, 7-bladed beta-propeller-domain-containing protein [Emericellopsis atlantica]
MNALAVLLLAGQASATYLYVASYSGFVSTLNLTETASGIDLDIIAQDNNCGAIPSWLTLKDDGTLICVDEGWRTWPRGTTAIYSTNDDGSLSLLSSVNDVLVGSVSTVVYGDDDSHFAIAHYAGSGISAWDIADPSVPSMIQQEIYDLEQPGADPVRQEAAHPHEVIKDPTETYILAPDLGADIVRIYSIASDATLEPVEPLEVPAGSGPRHAAFAVIDDATYLYIVNELANTILAYTVTYTESGMSFDEIYHSSIYGEDGQVPDGVTSAEILVTPDQKNVILSSRMDKSFEIPAFDGDGSVTSDTLANFAIDQSTGVPELLQTVPAGGMQPRQFSTNAEGSLVTVGLQGDGRVVVIERDVETGMLGDFVAWLDVGGEIMCVVWNEL